jgi:TRAP-type C4-dicarboxylate transport system permease small subunit
MKPKSGRMPTMKTFNVIFDGLVNALAFIAGFFIVCAGFIECYEVVMRYFLKRPPIWGVEVVEYMLFFIAFLGTTWVLRNKSHISVTILIEHLKPRSQTYCNLFACVMGIFISLVIFWFSLKTTWYCCVTDVRVVKTYALPKWWFLSFIALGYFLMLIEFVRQFFSHVKSLRTNEEKQLTR